MVMAFMFGFAALTLISFQVYITTSLQLKEQKRFRKFLNAIREKI